MNKFHVAISVVASITVITSIALHYGYDGGLALTVVGSLCAFLGSLFGFALGRMPG